MVNDQLPSFIKDLLHPDKYDHPVAETDLVQTHISYVILAGDFVYKFKKPVDFGFLNFSTLEKRKLFCRQELTLNQRLCPDIYLNMVNVTADVNGFTINGTENIVEYGVKMVRMPESAMMSNVIGRKELEKSHLDAIIDVLVPFYQNAEGGEKLKSFGEAESVGINVLENFEQTETFIGRGALNRQQFEIIGAYARSVLADGHIFKQRMDENKIRDCHGDLYSANICLDENVHIFDCIEFNERFRYSDIAADVAFLAMDLDFHGLDGLSEYFLNRFSELSADPGVLKLAGFYKCYRAYVRGKIGLFTAADPAVDPQVAAACIEQARKYFALAERYVRKEQG